MNISKQKNKILDSEWSGISVFKYLCHILVMTDKDLWNALFIKTIISLLFLFI